MWYRVTVQDGQVLTCLPVEESGADEDGVYYIRAPTDVLARKRAERAYWTARRRGFAAAGLCRCGKAREGAGFKTCAKCRDGATQAANRSRARAKGEPVPILKPGGPPGDVIRQQVLEQVQREWETTPNNRAFARWLAGQLEALRKRREA